MSSGSIQPGRRATKLDDIIDTSLNATLRACSYDKLASCFPSLAQHDSAALQRMQEDLVRNFESKCRAGFKTIMAERQVHERLRDFDDVLQAAMNRRATGVPPSESPSDLAPGVVLRAHLLPLKRAELSQLNTDVHELQQQNSQHLADLGSLRSQIDLKTRTLKDMLNNVDTALATTTSQTFDAGC